MKKADTAQLYIPMKKGFTAQYNNIVVVAFKAKLKNLPCLEVNPDVVNKSHISYPFYYKGLLNTSRWHENFFKCSG